MRDQMQDGMAEAARLTREGQLAEATAIIQRVLGGSFATGTADGQGDAGEPIEASFRVVDEAPRAKVNECRRASGSRPTTATRSAPESPIRFRGVPHLPGVLPGIMPGATEGVSAPSVVPAGGQFVERSYTDQAGTRAYKLYIPSGYVGQAVPLIVMLHGCTQSPDDFAAGTHMNTLAETHTFLVAYPAQAQNANMSKCWNWFKAADQQRGRGEPSLIACITHQIVEEYNVAADRVYVAGMSAGGAMTAIMGATYPDLYAAVGVHSGLAPGAAQDLSSAFAAMQNGGLAAVRHASPTQAAPGKSARIVPIIVFHGDRDTTVHPRNGDHLLAHYWAANGPGVTGASAPQVTTREERVPGGYTYTCATHHDVDGSAVAEQWTIHGLGHAWSGGSLSGSYTDPKGPDSSAEMMRFFDQHPRREQVGGW